MRSAIAQKSCTTPVCSLLALCYTLVLIVGPDLGAEPPTYPSLKKIRAHGVELHYIDQGKGVPVVFVHGEIRRLGVIGD